jgi:hypothetical protein
MPFYQGAAHVLEPMLKKSQDIMEDGDEFNESVKAVLKYQVKKMLNPGKP